MQVCQKTGRRKILLVPSASPQTRDLENKMDYLCRVAPICCEAREADNKTKIKKPKPVPLPLSHPPQHHGAPCSACAVTPDRPRIPLCDLAQGGDAHVLHQAVEINPCFLIPLVLCGALGSIRSSPAGSRNMFPVPLGCVPLCSETGACHPLVMLGE